MTCGCKKRVTWEGLKYHGKLMTSYMKGPLDFLPSVFGTKVTCYLTITMHQFGGNQKSAYYRSHNRLKSFQKQHFHFQLPAFLRHTISKLRQRKTVARQLKTFKLQTASIFTQSRFAPVNRNPIQGTGLENRGYLKVRNDTKLVLFLPFLTANQFIQLIQTIFIFIFLSVF